MSMRDAVNRANSQFSTGPKTEAGKQRSSKNALRHGLTAQTVVMPTEDPAAYQAHLKSFVDEYHPQGATETQLVQALADASWRLNRVASFEASLLSLPIALPTKPTLWASAKARDASEVADAFLTQSKALANLSLHSQRLSREFERTVTQLRKLQEARRAQESNNLPKNGFVFNEPEPAPRKVTAPRPSEAAGSPVQSINGRHR